MKIIALAAAATVAGTVAFASGPTVPYDPPVAPPMAVATYDWTGIYAGGTLGVGSTRHRVPGFGGAFPDATGGMAGGVVGYNVQRGNMVFGGEAALNWANLSGSAACINPAWTCTSDVSALGSIRGRLGYANDRTLVYVTGGVGAARIAHSTTTGGPVFSDTNTRTGWTLGLGVEQAMNNGWIFRGQFDYYRFGGSDYALDVPYLDEHTNIGTVSFSVLRRF